MNIEFIRTNISVFNYTSWIIFGGAAGFVAHFLSNNTIKGGIIISTVLGMLGAVAGGTFATFLYGVGMRGIDLTSLAVSLISSLTFLVLFHIVVKNTGKMIRQ